jgi:hypothetical protein
MAAPEGSTVQIIQNEVTLSDSSDATAVRLTRDEDATAMTVGDVALRDIPEATAIRLTTDESAPTLSVMQADKIYKHRQKELVKRLAERLAGRVIVTSHDLQCVRRVHGIDINPTFTYQAQHSPRKYTDAYVDWLVAQFESDPGFFQKTREALRVRSA